MRQALTAVPGKEDRPYAVSLVQSPLFIIIIIC